MKHRFEPRQEVYSEIHTTPGDDPERHAKLLGYLIDQWVSNAKAAAERGGKLTLECDGEGRILLKGWINYPQLSQQKESHEPA